MHHLKVKALVGCLLVGLTATTVAQPNITLLPDADATIRESALTPGLTTLEVRSRANAGSGRQRIPYIRFDLRVLAAAPGADAVFTITQNGGTAGDSITLWGLKNDFGNTGQQWPGANFIYTETGREIPGDGNAETQDLDTNRLAHIADLVTPGPGISVSVTNASLDAFIADRYANGGYLTVLITEPDGADRYPRFDRSSQTSPATLAVQGTLQAAPADTTAPEVANVDPFTAETGVLLESTVSFQFNEPVQDSTVTNSFSLAGPGGAVTGTLAFNANTFIGTFTPDALFSPLTTYTGTVSTASDTAGNPMAAPFAWSFTTEDADVVPPTVISVAPTNGATEVPFYASMSATFSEAMDETSINTNTFRLYDSGSNLVASATAYDAGTLTAFLSPAGSLADGETYTAVLSGVTDQVGNPLSADYSWSFTTATPLAGQVTLVSAADTYTRTGVNAGADTRLNVLGFGGGDFIAYIRFDLSAYEVVSGAELVLYKTGHSRNDTIITARHEVYGLTDNAGNTPQDWDESVDLVPGAEYTNTLGNDIDVSVVYNLDGDTGAAITEDLSGDPVIVTFGTDMDAFLNDRIAAGGLVTFIVAINADNRGYGFASKENLQFAPPLLRFFTDPPAPTLHIAQGAGSDKVLTWDGLSGRSYGVDRSDNVMDTNGWATIATGILASTYTDSPTGPQAFYRVFDEGAVSYFSDDFESDLGWTLTDNGAGTVWERGASTVWGPLTATSGTNVYGTVLNGPYTPSADASLISPVIDLSTASAPKLVWSNWSDFEGDTFDFGEVYVRDSTGGVIAGLEAPLFVVNDVFQGGAFATKTVPLPAAVVGTSVKIEFRFVSDASFETQGWYIDDVEVTE